jgi:hypothetical protein
MASRSCSSVGQYMVQSASRVERASGGMFGRQGRRAERSHTKKCCTVKSGGVLVVKRRVGPGG